MDQDFLKGRHAVITGVSRGIGKALAEALLDAGCRVTGWGRNAPSFPTPQFTFVPCDVSREEEVASAAAKTLAIAPVDFVVNNAGFGYFNKLEDFSAERFRRMWEVNVLGAFLVTKAFAPSLKQRGSGHILSISSTAGKVGMPQGEGYNSSKWALTGMMDCLFQELRSDGIKVTTVFPGSTATDFFNDLPASGPREWMLDPVEVARVLLALLNTSPNCLVRELEIRPLNSKPPKKV